METLIAVVLAVATVLSQGCGGCQLEYSTAEPVLTAEEMRIFTLLLLAQREFLELDEAHPSDHEDFMSALLDAQRIILARPAVRQIMESGATGGRPVIY